MTTIQKIKSITNAVQKIVIEKNKRYGDSAINPPKIFSNLDALEGLKVRLDDKLSRIQNSDKSNLRTNDICDIMGYCTLILVANGISAEEIMGLID